MSLSHNMKQLGAWHQQQIDRGRAQPQPLPGPLQPADLLPPGEEMVPDTPTDILSRYVALLNRWADLTARQAQYDAEMAALQARGASHREEWQALAEEHQACLAALATLTLPTDAMIREVWHTMKVHLRLLLTPDQRYLALVNDTVKAWAQALTLDPRGQQPREREDTDAA